MPPFVLKALLALMLLTMSASSAPTKQSERSGKSLNYYTDYGLSQQIVGDGGGGGEDLLVEYGGGTFDTDDDYAALDYEQNELSRTVPLKRKKLRRPAQAAAATAYNSPIYYIRLPPQPYMFVPGLGYVSQPPPPPANPMQQFLNVPISFVANGKPANIYQWSGLPQFAAPPPPAPVVNRPAPSSKPPKDSTIHRLPGQFAFNGKPDDIFVLRDSYNSLYSDALQNFYP